MCAGAGAQVGVAVGAGAGQHQQPPGAPAGAAPQQPAQGDTLLRLRRWPTASLEQFLLRMWEEMLAVRRLYDLAAEV